MSDHIPDATKMVPDGYYAALVQCDTGGEISMHVRVLDGIPRNARGAALRRDACRDFMPVCVEDFCRAWPWDADMELSALRAGNAALVEQSKTLLRERDHANDTASAVIKENAALVERVKRLEEAGDSVEDAVQSVQDWNGTYVGECLDAWNQAKAIQ
jgi:hypothetical protein